MSKYIQLIGIDYSVNSPAATIYTFNTHSKKADYKFIACTRGAYRIPQEVLFKDCEVEHIKLNKKPVQKGMSSQEGERFKIKDAMDVNAKFFNAIRNYIKPDDNEIHLAIEGFSFGSKGNSLVELAGYQYILRYLLNTFIITPDNFHVYAPSTIKAFAGNGRFKKHDMLNALMNLDDEQFFSSKLGIHLKSNWQKYLIIKKKSTDVAKPIDDIVDSYFIIKLLANRIGIESIFIPPVKSPHILSINLS